MNGYEYPKMEDIGEKRAALADIWRQYRVCKKAVDDRDEKAWRFAVRDLEDLVETLMGV